jgi:hypothetical protein
MEELIRLKEKSANSGEDERRMPVEMKSAGAWNEKRGRKNRELR